MRTIRVVIVDGDSASRRKLARAIEGGLGLDLVGASGFGPEAVEKVGRLQPDLVLIGIDATASEGSETLGMLRRALPELPILAIGPETRRGSVAALDAIDRGASACVAYADSDDVETLRGELLPRLRAVLDSPRHAPQENPSAQVRPLAPADGRIEAVVIGSSTGGPNGLVEVIRALPPDFPAPVLIVQHMPASFVGALSGRLHALRSIPVREAVDGEVARPGTAWIAPGGVHLEVSREMGALRMKLVEGLAENSCRPSADVLFRSTVRALGGRVLGVVLSGMGFDGLRGCRAIRDAGGTVLVQDEATSVVWGMPGNVAEAGLAHKILPIGEIGAEIVRLTMSARAGR